MKNLSAANVVSTAWECSTKIKVSMKKVSKTSRRSNNSTLAFTESMSTSAKQRAYTK